MRDVSEEQEQSHLERDVAAGRHALFTLIACVVAAAACGAPERPGGVRIPSDDLRAWDAVPPGEYLVYDATLAIGVDPRPDDSEFASERTIQLLGEWRARFFDGRRVRVSIGSTSITGHARSLRLSCTREPLRFTTGELVIDVPAGGRVSRLGAGDGLVRVAPPLAAGGVLGRIGRDDARP